MVDIKQGDEEGNWPTSIEKENSGEKSTDKTFYRFIRRNRAALKKGTTHGQTQTNRTKPGPSFQL